MYMYVCIYIYIYVYIYIYTHTYVYIHIITCRTLVLTHVCAVYLFNCGKFDVAAFPLPQSVQKAFRVPFGFYPVMLVPARRCKLSSTIHTYTHYTRVHRCIRTCARVHVVHMRRMNALHKLHTLHTIYASHTLHTCTYVKHIDTTLCYTPPPTRIDTSDPHSKLKWAGWCIQTRPDSVPVSFIRPRAKPGLR